MLHLNSQLKSLIDKLWDRFWSGGISNPLTAIEQITYLIFMRRIDVLDKERIANAELTGEEYKSLFNGEFPEPTEEERQKIANGEEDKVFRIKKEQLRWSEFSHLKAEEMLDLINQFVFPFLKELNGKNSHFTKHMKNAVFIIPNPLLLLEAIKIIELIFKEIEKDALENGQAFQDIQGDVYEMLLSEIASSGKNGQFRTPRHIINLLVDLVEPKYGDKIADPACGTGGFLLGAYQYILTTFDRDKKHSVTDENGFVRSTTSALLTEERKQVIGKSLRGYDIDVTMVRLGLMNLMMHGIDDPNIDYTDTLSKSFQKYSDEQNSYDVVLANPPFTGNINKGEIDDTLTLSTTKTELLFIDRIYSMLRDGGTAGIIIPQGVLFGSGKAFVYARKIMIEKSQLKAVITMPSGVFKPYAGVATAILIFTKGGETDKVFFYDMQSDGYSLDDKRVKLEGYGDLQDIITSYKNRATNSNDRSGNIFMVAKKEIVGNNYDLSHSSYKDPVYEEVAYDDPKDILDTLSNLEIEIQTELRKIKSLYA
ncbi:N-6 DNA methylase [Aliarcobacter skirrowii]|uniref:type I restriction-modification system subunit M n=1 Tax=Aliarcobacter skirrowii TaxID=28200 RepID=UPI0029ABB02A|nr:N-6 DNA methylase [Aliarcobacter skirrowii]MDX3960570.1 N-6 DNA methylase [Aliarcobacter skirrowii]MDX3960574.1 N-6 DNA methylase [Aliarcobacter skirrowii]